MLLAKVVPLLLALQQLALLPLPAHGLASSPERPPRQSPPPPPQADPPPNPDGAVRPPPPRQRPDERQAAMMEKMGYVWDGTRWYRGDERAYRIGKAGVRSGNRFARFVQASGAPASSPAALAAARRLEEVLQGAREEATPERSGAARALDRDAKNALSHPASPPLWYAAQLCLLAGASAALGIDWDLELGRALDPLTWEAGAAAGLAVAECRRRARGCRPGVEEGTGRVERMLADGAVGGVALPSPTHVRGEGGVAWTAFALGGELLADATSAVWIHTGVQAAILTEANRSLVWRLVASTSDLVVGQYVAVVGAAAAAVAVALPPLAAAMREAAGSGDGAVAEIQAAARAGRGAAAYFNMVPAVEADAGDAAEALRALSEAWTDKFGNDVDGAEWKLPVYTFAGSLASALAWQLSGGAVAAPLLARAIGSLDTYVLRFDPEADRANLPLPAERESKGGEAI